MTVLSVHDLPLVGGCLCLDFVNTTGNRAGDSPRERLGSYRDLLAWSRHVGLLEPGEERALAKQSVIRSAEAAHVYGQALRVRETLYRLLVTVADRTEPASSDLEELNRLVVVSCTRRRLQAGPAGGFGWVWDRESTRPDCMIWPVVHSASELLSSAEIQKLRRCGECDWLFLDSTKNGSRLWCKKACGDRVKSRRYYARRAPGRSRRA